MKTVTPCLCILGLTAAANAGTLLMDQIGANDGSDLSTANMFANQIFEAAYSVYSVACVDDFDNSGGSSASSVSMVMGGWNGYAGIDGVSGLSANFYTDPDAAGANLVGYASVDVDGTPTPDPDFVWAGYDMVTVEGSFAVNAGTAYVALIPSNEFATNGQTGCALSMLSDGSLDAGWQCNPGGGFGFNVQPTAGSLALRVTSGGPSNPCETALRDAPCNADVDYDNVVGVEDLLGVIGTFGDVGDGTYRPLGDCAPLPNGDCVVDVEDVLAVISGFGADCTPVDPTGGCCMSTGDCATYTQAQCDAMGGNYFGDDSDCSACVYGACCYGDGTCAEVLDTACSGNFVGGTCADAGCQPITGACCLDAQTCLDNMSPEDCAAFAGEFAGDGTSCLDAPCGWPGCNASDTPEGLPCQEDTTADDLYDLNGGNNSNPPSFGAIADGETICGYASVYTCIGCGDSGEDLSYRDTDWYLFDNSAGGDWTVSGGGQLSLLMGIVDNDAGAFVANFVTEPYEEGEVTATLPAGGNYSVFVAPADWDQPTCSVGDNDYSVTLSGSAAADAACCVATSCVGDLSPADCDALGGTYVAGESCATYTCPNPYQGCTDSNVNESDYGCVCFVDGDDSETDCNGGSNMASPRFTPLSSGDVICGEMSVYIEGPTGGTYRDLDWWTSTEVNAGGTFDFSIGSQMSTVILLVNLDAGTVDMEVTAAPGTIAEVTWTIGAGNWSVVTAPSEWNTAWTCASGMSEYRFSMD